MAEAIRKVNIIGHLNPDTDSICAAISYAYLKIRLTTLSMKLVALAHSTVRLRLS